MPDGGASRPPISLQKVDLPLPFEPSRRCGDHPGNRVRVRLREHLALAIAGAGIVGDHRQRQQASSGPGRLKGWTSRSTIVAIVSIFSSRLTRTTRRALVAFALKRSTKDWRCLRSASCFSFPLAAASPGAAWRRRYSRRDRSSKRLVEMQDVVDAGVERLRGHG